MDAASGVGMIAAVGVESGGVIAVECSRGAEVDPVFVKNPLSADHAVVQIEQAEFRPVARTCEHVVRTLQRADAVELKCDGAHAERIEQFAPGKSERPLGSPGGIPDDTREDLR